MFQKSLAYARQIRPAAIFILSAKYGIIRPDDQIDSYNVTLSTMSSSEIKAWSDNVLSQLQRHTDVEHDHFVVLAGDKYRRYLVTRLPSVEVPMESLRIGEQLRWLNNHLA